MKYFLSSLVLLLALGCNNADNPSVEEVKSKCDLSIAYQDIIYNFGDTIDIMLTMTQENSQDDRFLLSVVCAGGKASARLDGEDLPWAEHVEILDSHNNDPDTSQPLHFQVLTPSTCDALKQTLLLDFKITNLAGDVVAAKRVVLHLANLAPIYANAQYNDASIEITDSLPITLSAEKAHYNGSFIVTPTITKGSGIFVVDGKNHSSNQTFSLPSKESIIVHYQPTSLGVHELSFRISESTSSTNIDVRTGVFYENVSTKPSAGVYIYANNLFFKPDKWDRNDWQLAEGVAIFHDECSFIISPKQYEDSWARGPKPIPSAIPTCVSLADAINDFNGKANTETLIAFSTEGLSFPLANHCYTHDQEAIGKWYLPSAGQMNIIFEYLTEINNCLSLINGKIFGVCLAYDTHPSSTASAAGIWALSESYSYKLDFMNDKNWGRRGACHPICNIPE